MGDDKQGDNEGPGYENYVWIAVGIVAVVGMCIIEKYIKIN